MIAKHIWPWEWNQAIYLAWVVCCQHQSRSVLARPYIGSYRSQVRLRWWRTLAVGQCPHHYHPEQLLFLSLFSIRQDLKIQNFISLFTFNKWKWYKFMIDLNWHVVINKNKIENLTVLTSKIIKLPIFSNYLLVLINERWAV